MQAGAIEVKRERGVIVVNALGRTPSGTKFIKAKKALKATKFSDKTFKAEMIAAVEELLGE
jgi:hypothetical protein